MISIELPVLSQMLVEGILQNLVGCFDHNLLQCLLELKWQLFGFD